MEKIKDCPFCKCQPTIFKRYGRRANEEYREMFFAYKVKCINDICFVQPETKYWKHEYEAIHSWNDRTGHFDCGRPNVK